MKSMRVPSYKAIALCILQNDLHLYGLGFQPHVSHWYKVVKTDNFRSESEQMNLL
jgi:predicted phosphoadenosine phosphosulfate sulfurtransferase